MRSLLQAKQKAGQDFLAAGNFPGKFRNDYIVYIFYEDDIGLLFIQGPAALMYLRQFLSIFVEIYFVIVMFVYLIDRYGLPVDKETEDTGLPAEAAK